MNQHTTPGVYGEEVTLLPAVAMRTGVPAFIGFTQAVPADALAQPVTSWAELNARFGLALPGSYLHNAVRGFFENGGKLCYIIRLDDQMDIESALQKALSDLAPSDAVDLVCAPDIMARRLTKSDIPQWVLPDSAAVLRMQNAILQHCATLGDRFAILDAWPVQDLAGVLQQRHGLRGTHGALYYPWVQVAGVNPAPGASATLFVPACGHIAGVYAAVDEQFGVHKAPANVALQGVLDLADNLTDAQQGQMNPVGINALRAFPGRGIRVWGARSLSEDSNWIYVNVRRLFITVGRWIERNMASVSFESNQTYLWARINRELTAYLNGLYQQGAFLGQTARQAFYVKCDGDTNPPEVRDAGMLITEIGLAPASPGEFIVVRIIHSASGINVIGPVQPGQ